MRLIFSAVFACVSTFASAQSLPAYVPANGLVGYYPLSKALELKDISGNGNDGLGHSLHIKDIMPFHFVPAVDRFGNDGGAMSFEAQLPGVSAENQITVSPRQSLKFSRGFSIGGWRYSFPMQFSQSFFSKDHTTNTGALEILYSYDNLNFQFAAEGDSIVRLSSAGDPLAFIGWHFVAGTFDGNSLRLYVDGELAAEQFLGIDDLPAFQQNVDANGSFRIGHNVTPYVFNSAGSVEDVFIYNRALTPGEVQSLFQAGGDVVRRPSIGFGLEHITLDNYAGIYPDIKSATKPRAAAAINKAMQMVDFGKIRTLKKPGALQPDKNGISWSYTITWPTKRLLVITTMRETTNTESRGGETLEVLVFPHYFDVGTGDIISVKSFFTPEGYASLARKLNERKVDLSKASMSINPFGHQLTFVVGDIDSGETSVTLSLAETNPALSTIGNYYFNGGPVPVSPSPDHLWTGLIGAGIHVTLLVQTDSPSSLKGMEVYDNYGTVIQLKGQFVNGVLKLNEMDDKGNVGGSFEAVMKDRKLSGKWSNKDGSKTMPFSAVIAGE